MRRFTGWRGCWKGARIPRYLARRITRMAVEDIGLPIPAAQRHCLDAWSAL